MREVGGWEEVRERVREVEQRVEWAAHMHIQ